MAYVSTTALKYLSDKRVASGPLQEEWAKLDNLYNKKLWHQTTLLLLEMIKDASFKNGEILKLYNEFVTDFESRINPISLVEICGRASEQIAGVDEAIAFLEKIEAKTKSSDEAVVLCRVYQGSVRLRNSADLPAAKRLIEELAPLVDALSSVSFIHGRYFHVASEYHKLVGEHAQYFRTALRFLGCTDLSEMPLALKQKHAFFLSLAALMGADVYNFGELLAHPVLESLASTEHAWLIDLLAVFNRGDLVALQRLRPQWSTQPDLAAKEPQLLEKIQLLALMEMTFQRASTERCMTFADVMAVTQLPEERIELLVMRALAQGLVRGHMDQVDATVHLNWVQPRVLDKTQLKSMISRLDTWCCDVESMEKIIEQKAHDILTL